MPRLVISLGAQARNLLAGQPDAAGGLDQAGDGVAQRGLAHAVAPDDGEHAALDREGHALQRVRAAVVDVEAIDHQDRAARLARRHQRIARTTAASVLAPHVDRLHLRVVLDLARACRSSARGRCASRSRARPRLSAMSRSCSISTKLMCAGSEFSSATSSRRSAGDSPAAGSSNRIRRGAPASAMPISSWRCWPCDEARHRLVGDVREAHALEQVVGGHRRMRGSRARARSEKRPLATPRTARNRLSRTAQCAEQQR